MKSFIENKKSILNCIGFLFLVNSCSSQDTNRISYYLANNEFAKAKESIDSVAAMYKTAPVFLLKARVYTAIAKDPATKSLAADAKWEAFLALNDAMLADSGYVNRVLGAVRYRFAFDLSAGFEQDGIILYNAAAAQNNKEGFVQALAAFKRSEAVKQFIFANSWAKISADTVLLFYLSKSAINAGKEEDAVFYSKKIIDSYVVYLPFKMQYEQVYTWLVYYYKGRRDTVAFTQYLQAGKAQFPQSGFFILAELDWFRIQKYYSELFAGYRHLLQTGKAEPSIRLAYCRDMFAYLWPEDGKRPVEKLVSSKELTKELLLLVNQADKSRAMDARLLLAKVYINLSGNLAAEMHAGAGSVNYSVLQSRRRNLIQQSNKYLTQILADKNVRQQPQGKEAATLLTANKKSLRQG